MQRLNQSIGRRSALRRIYVRLRQDNDNGSNLALHKCAYTPFGISNDLDVPDLSVLRQMLHEHAREVTLVNVGRKTTKVC